jgi:hypothetical protein
MGAGFFALDVAVVEFMAESGFGGDAIAAFMVISRGVNSRFGWHSSHGARSVSQRLGLTYRAAEKALGVLEEAGLITDESDSPQKPRWCISQPEQPAYMPNTLLDGVGHGEPPIARIVSRMPAPMLGSRSAAKADALMLLARLYQADDIAECGGIDPRVATSTIWKPTENAIGEQVMQLEGTDGWVVEIAPEGDVTKRRFLDQAFPNAETDDERRQRFATAIAHLEREGLIYRTIQVWNANPLRSQDAELDYCLWVADRHARQTEPFLAYEIHRAMNRTQTIDAYAEFARDDFDDAIVRRGIEQHRFRFVSSRREAVAVGTWRLRFRPATRDNAIGWQREIERNSHWKDVLTTLGRQ